jgi:uncharacterized protein YuzE
MKISYDAEMDALYIQLRELGPGQAENRDLGDGIVADFAPDGRIAGIEILDASAIVGSNKEQVIVELAPARRSAA